MEVQDYTSLVAALNTVDQLLESDIKKSVYIAEDKKQHVFEQMCAYLSETLTPLLQHPAFYNHRFFDRHGILIDIQRYGVKGANGGYSAQFYHGSLGTGSASRCYFLNDGSIVIEGDFNSYKMAELAGIWPDIKAGIKEMTARHAKNYAEDAKKKSAREAGIAEILANFEV